MEEGIYIELVKMAHRIAELEARTSEMYAMVLEILKQKGEKNESLQGSGDT